MHIRRACRTALFGATAARAFWFVFRNSLGTWNVPNLLCRAKTSWSWHQKSCVSGMEGDAPVYRSELETCRDGRGLEVGRDG